MRRLKPIGDFVHTITFDNGKEFAAHQDIAHALKTKIFFATPYHAWERGLNENTNGLIRDFFRRGKDFSTIQTPRLPRSNVCSTRDLENPSASVHPKRFSTPSLTLKFLCAGEFVSALLCREVQVNFAYRWFCKLGIEHKIPDHSVFWRARNERFRVSGIFRRVFERVAVSYSYKGR